MTDSRSPFWRNPFRADVDPVDAFLAELEAARLGLPAPLSAQSGMAAALEALGELPAPKPIDPTATKDFTATENQYVISPYLYVQPMGLCDDRFDMGLYALQHTHSLCDVPLFGTESNRRIISQLPETTFSLFSEPTKHFGLNSKL